jgi:hypothetical protein
VCELLLRLTLPCSTSYCRGLHFAVQHLSLLLRDCNLVVFQKADGTYTVTYEHNSCTETIPVDSDEDLNFDALVSIGWYAERENTWRISSLNLIEDKTDPELQ